MGRIVKPHGLRGEVVVRVLSENPARFQPGAQLLVGSSPAAAAPMDVGGVRTHQGRLLVRFQEVSTVEQAEALRDLDLFVAAESLEDLEEDQFWEHELAGLTVIDTTGRVLGTLDDVIERPSQDLWAINTPIGEVLFPAAKELVVTVDLENKRIVVDPPEGLFE